MKKVLLIGTLLLMGCKAEFTDISDSQEYKILLGTNYSLVDEMYISGINLPPEYGKNVDIYEISQTSPSWTGPELIIRDTLSIGTTITINNIQKCTNCLDKRVQALVSVAPYKKTADVPVAIDIKYIRNDKYMKTKPLELKIEK